MKSNHPMKSVGMFEALVRELARSGTVECDLTTHSVKRRPMAIAQYRNKQIVPLAFYNVGGADFRLA